MRKKTQRGNAKLALLGVRSATSAERITISVVEEEDKHLFEVSASQSSDSNLVTLKVASWSFIRFEIDPGSRCNVLTVHIYKKAKGAYSLKDVTPAKLSIVDYDGNSIQVLGTVKIQVQCGSLTCLLLYRLVESKRPCPILGKTACEEMGVILESKTRTR